MNSLDYRDADQDFESRLRAMLRRRAADVRPNPPAWQDLIRDADAVVVSLRTGEPVHTAPAHRKRRRPWIRPLLAAAASLAVAMGAGIAIGRSDGSNEPGDRAQAGDPEQPDESALLAPDDADFDPATAEMIFPFVDESALRQQVDTADGPLPNDLVWMGDPREATERYLADVGIAPPEEAPYVLRIDEEPVAQPVVLLPDGSSVETATMWWSLRATDGRFAPDGDQPVLAIGPVYLRNLRSADLSGPAAWVVVGAYTQGLILSDVRWKGDTMSFSVIIGVGSGVEADASQLPVRIMINGEIREERDLSTGDRNPFSYTVPVDQPATIRLQQVGDHPWSVTEVTFAPRVEPPLEAPVTTAPTTVTTPPSVDQTTP